MRQPRFSSADLQITVVPSPSGSNDRVELVRALNAALAREAARLAWEAAADGMACPSTNEVHHDDDA
jgi:aminoglycoside phosphotransferase